jgi:uncharacterized protein (DUF4213/DUF364 family)
MQEPLTYFYQKYHFHPEKIHQLVIGKKYVAVELIDGKLGVCATLNHPVNGDITSPNLKDISFRIVLNAYYNALFNYQNSYNTSLDIFDAIDFKKAGNVVMIGHFKSLVNKFEKQAIQLSIFDLFDNSDKITPLHLQHDYLSKADTLVLTSTSVFNNSFIDLISATSDQCRIYLLGPSSLMHPDMFSYRNIELLFGSIFKQNKKETLELIQKGEGTPSFSKYMTKVILKK